MDDPLLCITHIVFFQRKSDQTKSFFALVNDACCSLKSANIKIQVILAKVTEKVRTLIPAKAEFIRNVNQAYFVGHFFKNSKKHTVVKYSLCHWRLKLVLILRRVDANHSLTANTNEIFSRVVTCER